MILKTSSLTARNAVRTLGSNIRVARKKRRISIAEFAERMNVSKGTVIRLEKGDEGIRIGTLAMACLVLGEIGLISRFFDSASDDTGLLLDRENLPKRIDRPRKKSKEKLVSDKDAPGCDDGVAF